MGELPHLTGATAWIGGHDILQVRASRSEQASDDDWSLDLDVLELGPLLEELDETQAIAEVPVQNVANTESADSVPIGSKDELDRLVQAFSESPVGITIIAEPRETLGKPHHPFGIDAEERLAQRIAKKVD
jgi:hypothetical protein